MRITDEAKVLIEEALVSNNYDCLAVMLEESCCGTSFNFGLGTLEEEDEPIIINGIAVMMDAKAQARTENVTLAVEDGELVVQDDGPSCNCES